MKGIGGVSVDFTFLISVAIGALFAGIFMGRMWLDEGIGLGLGYFLSSEHKDALAFIHI